MISSPQISVIIPVYNAEQYLKECLDSLLCQSMREIEIICVDDGSSDTSPKILQKYAEQDSRVTVINQKNQYAGMARNKGMEIAKGKYLIFLDADDFFHPDMLRRAYWESEKYCADITFFNLKCYSVQTKISFRGKWLYNRSLIPNKRPFSRHDVSHDIFQLTTAAPWNKLFRTDFIRTNHLVFQGTHSANDLYFVNLSLALAERISTIHQPLMYYRVDMEGNLQSTQAVSPFDFYTACKALKNSLKERGVFEEVEQSFVNFALGSAINTLRKLKQSDSYCLVVKRFRTNIAEDLGILSHITVPGYFYLEDEYQILKDLMDPRRSECSALASQADCGCADRKTSLIGKAKGVYSCFCEHGFSYTWNEILKSRKK